MSFTPVTPLDPLQRYSVPEALAYLRTSRAKFYQSVTAGNIRVIKDGARTYVPGSEIIKQSALPNVGK